MKDVMAYTRKLPSGTYQGCYRDHNDKIRSAGTYAEEGDALIAALKAENGIRQPGAEEAWDDTTPYGEYFGEWLDERIVAPATIELYTNTADNHILPTWKTTPLRRIKVSGCQKWVSAMHRDGVSVWVIRNATKIMSATLNTAATMELIPFNPMKKVKVPRTPKGLERFLTADEVDRIMFFMPTERDKLIVDVLSQTGLRFGELAGLHRACIDWTRKVLDIKVQFDQHSMVIKELKDHEPRTVPVSSELLAKLRAYVDAHPWDGTGCGVEHVDCRCPGGGLLFTTNVNKPFRSSTWGRDVWHPCLALAEIKGRVRPHDLRHTYASWLIQEGVEIPIVAQMMGHSSWEMVKRYAHLDASSYVTARDAIVRRRAAAPSAGRSLRAVEAPTDDPTAGGSESDQKAS